MELSVSLWRIHWWDEILSEGGLCFFKFAAKVRRGDEAGSDDIRMCDGSRVRRCGFGGTEWAVCFREQAAGMS